MSHVASMATTPGSPLFADIDALRKAAELLGCEMVEQNTYTWWGRSVGDYPLPPGMQADELGKNAKYVIKLSEATKKKLGVHSPYEIGIVEDVNNPGCYVPVYDFYAGGQGLSKVVGDPVHEDGERRGAVKMLCPWLVQNYHMVCDSLAAKQAGDRISFLKLVDAKKQYPAQFAKYADDEHTWISVVDTSARLGIK